MNDKRGILYFPTSFEELAKDFERSKPGALRTAPTAYRCFLPDLAGLGGGHERSAWLRALEESDQCGEIGI